MRRLWAWLLAVGMALFSALTLVTVGASVASASSHVTGYTADVSGLKVQVFSQMCDAGGPNLHTRLAVMNTTSSAKTILVHDQFARAVYDPPGPIPPGKGMLVHLTSSSRTPGHTLLLASDGQTKTLTIPESPCPTIPPTTKPTTSTTKPTTTTTKSTTSTSGPPTSSTVIVGPGGGGDPGGGVVTGAGVVGASVGSSGAVKAASTGTLPFTGSDIRGFAVIGNFLVLIGFAMLLLSHRSPRAASFFKRLRPSTSS